MSPISHLLIAWVIANLFSLQLRERRLCLIMGVISDIDGVFILFSEDLFLQYHHTFGHALIFGIPLALLSALFSEKKAKASGVYIIAFSLHLVADIFGSNWAVYPFLPFSSIGFSVFPNLSNYVIYGIINPIVLVFLLIFLIWVLIKKRRTPIEFLSKKWDGIISNFFALPITEKCDFCQKRAFFKCKSCGKYICSKHIIDDMSFICRECSMRSDLR